jgi:hypothetical protein
MTGSYFGREDALIVVEWDTFILAFRFGVREHFCSVSQIDGATTLQFLSPHTRAS